MSLESGKPSMFCCVESEIRPAIAEGSAGRHLDGGFRLRCLQRRDADVRTARRRRRSVSSLTSVSILRLMRPSDRTTGVKCEADTELLVM